MVERYLEGGQRDPAAVLLRIRLLWPRSTAVQLVTEYCDTRSFNDRISIVLASYQALLRGLPMVRPVWVEGV